MDQSKIDAFAERVANDVNAGLTCLNVYLGVRLGLFQAIAEAGPLTPAQLSARTTFNERYLREWLECMAVADILDVDAAAGRFSLSPEHAVALLERDNMAYVGPYVLSVPGMAGILPALMDAFRQGGGVPYAAYGTDTREFISHANRPTYLNEYVSKWIPAMPDIQARLAAGARVADVGCGEGWSSISLALGFPKVHVDGLDVDAASIEQARRNAEQSGVGDRVHFHLAAAEDAPFSGPCALVTAFECIHDMPYPVRALRGMRALAAPDGAVLIADEAIGESLDDNRNFFGRLMYNFSVLHCLPQAMVFPEAAGTGTIMPTSRLRQYAHEAGFARVDVLPIENPFWRFYRLTG